MSRCNAISRTSRSNIFAIVAAAALAASASTNAAAANDEPSPFAGQYRGAVSAVIDIEISDLGRVQGTWFTFFAGGTISGTVSDDGIMKLRFRTTSTRRGNTTRAMATVSKDADGDLVGMWLWEGAPNAVPYELFAVTESN